MFLSKTKDSLKNDGVVCSREVKNFDTKGKSSSFMKVLKF